MSDELKLPIILFGNFRSGTTMLQKLIATHPDVVSLYEPVGLWLYADPGRSHDEFDEKDATDNVKRYMRNEFLKYQQQHGNRMIVEKTPHNILRIPYVRAIFPEAHFLYIVRNPLSFVSSVELKWQQPATRKRIVKRLRSTPVTQLHHYLKRFLSQQWNNRILRRKYLSIWGPRYKGIQEDLKTENLMTVIARQWSRSSSKAERDLALFEPGQVLRLRYEDFVQDPISDMERICAHCGLQMTDEMAKTVKETVKTDRKLKWQRFEPDVLARILPELCDEMERHGYEIPVEISHVIEA
ncbi:MAG TPA: sulfotransferase [Anaerolineales bacterium]|nr:sulfotransferase [Anaerolineales bacterium]